jgi:general secretion pathway protein D
MDAGASTDTRLRKLTAVSLAVASVLQPVALGLARAPQVSGGGSSPASGSPISAETPVVAETFVAELAPDNESLKQAIAQYDAKEYEEAAATLSTIKVDELSASDKSTFDRLSGKVGTAVEGRKAARASFEKGEALLAEHKLAEAIAAYEEADSKWADKATHTKALEQINLAEAQQRSMEAADKAEYAEARELLYKGDLDGAKAKFQTLADHGYKAGLFQRSPQSYLKEIGERQAAPKAEAPSAPAAPATPATPAAPAATSKPAVMDMGPTAKDYYTQGVQQYRDREYAAAQKSFEAAQQAGYKTGWFEKSPADYLKLIAEQMATPAAPAKVAEAPAVPAAPATPAAPVAPAAPAAPAVAAATTKPSGEDKSAVSDAGKEAYELGVKEYKAGDLDSAEKSFQIAVDAGYKPSGWFEDAPEKFLKQIGIKRMEMAAEQSATTRHAAEKAEADAMAAKTSEAHKEYVVGRDAYRSGDWTQARVHFVRAVELGYKAGFLEVSPEDYLEKMTKKEQADAARHAEELAKAAADEKAKKEADAAMAKAPEPTTKPAVAVAPPAAPMAPVAPAAPTMPAVPPISANDLVAQAKAAQLAGDPAKANELYARALIMDPNNAAAKAGQADLAAAQVPASPLMTEVQRQIQAKRQVINYNFDVSIQSARDAITRGDFNVAAASLEAARAARNTDPTIFTPAEISSFDGQIAKVSSDIEIARLTKQKADLELANKENARATLDRIDAARAERDRTIAALIKRTQTLIAEGKFQEALNVIDQISAIDPTNEYALAVRPLVEDRAVIQEQLKYKKMYNTNISRQMNRAQEIQIPYDDLLRYPENWPDISEIRDADTARRRGETAQDQQTQAILDKAVPEIRFEGTAFGDVIESLKDLTGANINVEWSVLEAAGIDKTTQVNVGRLTNMRFEKVLRTILDAVGGNGTPLDFFVDEGLITISTKEKIAQQTKTVVYDVSDLLFRPLDAGPPPQIQFQLTAVQRGGGGGDGGNLFGGGQGGGGNQNDRPPATIIEDLIQMIQDLVDPDQWQAQGGSGNIRQFQTGSSYSLIVTATRKTHRDLDQLLAKLRASQAVQVSVEARFLQISRAYLEDIGLNLDVTLNNNGSMSPKFGSNTGTNGSFVNQIPIQQNSSTFTANPRTGLPSALSALNDTTSPALGIQGSFLDDFSVNFLLNATQASVNTSTAQAPRLTMFSGQRARVLVGSYQFFVTDLTPIVGTGAVAFQPNPTAVFSGVQLWVQAVVSADRKYVQLNLVPQLTQLTGVQNFVFQTTADNTGGNNGGQLPPGSTYPVAGIATATIQLPTQSSTQLYTSCSIPDGGTVLLGGLTQGGETQNEMGVPILSKIPFLKRLFTNRSNATDENVLLILVKPTIIIEHEIEEKSFPLLSNKVNP